MVTRHRCPIRRRHADDTTCEHKIRPSGRPAEGEHCPGVAGYEAECTCGHTIRAAIRAIVEESRRTHLGEHAAKGGA